MKYEDNVLLTRTGPDSEMGKLMRCFWIPAMISPEIPLADEPPKRLRLLGEDLVVIRDTDNRIGVLEERCPHRGASLFFGRNEECGLRCVYHGWKFDVTGACIDMPNEPPDTPMKQRVKARAYEARESGGILWVYMGEMELLPELPQFEFMDIPDSHRYVSRWEQDCNYAQAMEGELDGAHVSFLHRLVQEVDKDERALTGAYFRDDTAPKWIIKETDAGFIAGNARFVGEDKSYWRLNQFLLPFYTMIPPRPGDALITRMWIPKDDEHCWVICVTFRTDEPIRDAEKQEWINGENAHRKVIPGTTTPTERIDNDYLVDRVKQKTITFTGIEGIRTQDAMVTETAGSIADRTKEHLGSSDRGVVAMRRRLINAARELVNTGVPPLPAKEGIYYRVRATSSVLQRQQNPEEVAELIEDALPKR